MDKGSIVLFSGGIDSTACLLKALNESSDVLALTFDYGQTNRTEIESARAIVSELGVRQKLITLDSFFVQFAKSELLGTGSPNYDGLPGTFVPGRNFFFLGIAAVIAHSEKKPRIYIGSSNYDTALDGHRPTIDAIERALQLSLGYDIEIATPLADLTKTDIIRMVQHYGRLDLLKYTISCYNGVLRGCGKCLACKRRDEAFLELGLTDPAKEASNG